MGNDLTVIHVKGGGRIHAIAGMDENWVLKMWNWYVESATYGSVVVDLSAVSPTDRPVIKVYVVRKKNRSLHHPFESRIAHEGHGYLAFARAGLPVAPLLFWGEKRRLGLFAVGALATRNLPVDTVSEAYRKTPDDELLRRAAAVLGFVHRSGFCHGDPRARNFLATSPRPILIDLAAWSDFSAHSQQRDLTRFLGSAALLTGDTNKADSLLDVYVQEGPSLPVSRQALMEMADHYRREIVFP